MRQRFTHRDLRPHFGPSSRLEHLSSQHRNIVAFHARCLAYAICDGDGSTVFRFCTSMDESSFFQLNCHPPLNTSAQSVIECGPYPASPNFTLSPAGRLAYPLRAAVICKNGYRLTPGAPGSVSPFCQIDGTFQLPKDCSGCGPGRYVTSQTAEYGRPPSCDRCMCREVEKRTLILQ